MTMSEVWPLLRPLCRKLALLGWASSAADMLAVAREVRHGVVERFGIELHPEPLLIGVAL